MPTATIGSPQTIALGAADALIVSCSAVDAVASVAGSTGFIGAPYELGRVVGEQGRRFGPYGRAVTLIVSSLSGSITAEVSQPSRSPDAGDALSASQAAATQALVSEGGILAVGILGQSNERGQVDPAEAIGGTLSRTAYPQAFRSLVHPDFRYPVGHGISLYGGMLFAMYDALVAAGYAPRIVNSGIGSISMIRDACGQIQTRANSTAYRQKRASEGLGDMGYAGDVMVVQGRVFLCTTGVKAYACYNGNGVDLGGPTFLDYIRTVGSQVTAGSEPAGLATAAVGDVVTDGTVQWTCLSASTTYNGFSYAAGNIITESRYGFDPFGLVHRLWADLWAVRDAKQRVAILQNAQGDTSNANLSYQSSLENIASYLLNRGIKVAIGLSCYNASGANTTAYDNLTTRVNNALTTVRTNGNVGVYYPVENVITGANLYTLMGSTGAMAAGGAYFAKDSGQDNIHLNAPGAIVGGGHMAAALIDGLAA
jgi:hypothetical protein